MSEIKEEEILRHVAPEHYFRVANGTVIKGIMDLDSSLENMGEETFRYHVTDTRNDFSAWTRDIIKDDKLADELLMTKDRIKTQVVVLRKIVGILSKKLNANHA